MEFTLTHRGIPIGTIDTADARGLAVISVAALPAAQVLRTELPVWPATGVTAIGARGLSDSVEWRDPQGASVPAARIDVWRAEHDQLLVFTTFDTAVAGIPARIPQSPKLGSGESAG